MNKNKRHWILVEANTAQEALAKTGGKVAKRVIGGWHDMPDAYEVFFSKAYYCYIENFNNYLTLDRASSDLGITKASLVRIIRHFRLKQGLPC